MVTSDRQEPEAVLQGIRAVGLALDVLDAAMAYPTAELAGREVRRVIEGLNEAELRAALSALALDAVWRMPLPSVAVRTDADVWNRQQELQRWAWSRRRALSEARTRVRVAMKRQQGPPPRVGPPGRGA